MRERHRHAVARQPQRLLPLFGRDQIQRADLIVLAPASPVGELGHPAIDVRLRRLRAVRDERSRSAHDESEQSDRDRTCHRVLR